MGDDPGTLQDADWFQPNTYSLWVYDRGDKDPPIFLVVYEWERAGFRGVLAAGVCAGVWLNIEENFTGDWYDHPAYQEAGGDPEDIRFARLVEEGKVHRIGSLPSIGWFPEPPRCFTE